MVHIIMCAQAGIHEQQTLICLNQQFERATFPISRKISIAGKSIQKMDGHIAIIA